jgi:hypothetical protein
MGQYLSAAVERAMKVQEVILKAIAKMIARLENRENLAAS